MRLKERIVHCDLLIPLRVLIDLILYASLNVTQSCEMVRARFKQALFLGVSHTLTAMSISQATLRLRAVDIFFTDVRLDCSCLNFIPV